MIQSRRSFLQSAAAAPFAAGGIPGAAAGPASIPPAAPRPAANPERLLFVSKGRTGIVNVDGTGLRFLELEAPDQVTWQPCGIFPDGRVLFLSMEARRDGPGKPFDQYYTQTPTRIWAYDLDSGSLSPLAEPDRIAVFTTPQLILGGDRLLVQTVKEGRGRLYSIRLDGSDPTEFTREGDGFPYGLSLSPKGDRVAFHLAGPEGYRVWTSGLDGGGRALVAGAPGHLYFGTSWSPGGDWILYADCRPGEGPGHDWADVCIGRPEGGEHRKLTEGGAMWFGAAYGGPSNRGGGSNLPAWTRDGRILYPRRLPGSKVAWEFQANRPDTDHFNRDFKPERARGGTEVRRLDPWTGESAALTAPGEGVWDFRCAESPSGNHIAFCRAKTGEAPSLWTMDPDGGNPRELARGLGDAGADHPRWVPGGKRLRTAEPGHENP